MFDLKEEYNGNLKWLTKSTILFGLAGSRSYNLHSDESDFDYKGIAIPPREYFYGFLNKFEQAEYRSEDKSKEFTIYEIRKFINLAAQANPNILELLWLDDQDYIIKTSFGEKLIENKEKFLSKKVVYTYSGYAAAQLKKIKLHRSHLLAPPKKEPQREEFGLPKDKALLSKDQQGAFMELVSKDVVKEGEASPNFLEALIKEKAYFAAKRSWDQYQEWKHNRNPKRAIIEEKYGYDCKHGVHLYRLMIQAREILMQGKLIVKRTEDREQMMQIRNGAWSYDKLIEWAERQERELMEITEISTLRKEPDRKYIDDLCINIVESYLAAN